MDTEKLDLKSPDLVNENFEKLAELFPNCVTEGADGKAIDFDLLKQELSHAVVEGNKERYRLEWPGKREAIVTANLPTTKTLRPVREDSVDFDNTENLYIEGDNLEVLKLLQESYLGKVKMIYIDPPYNTGKDFVYKDNFSKAKQEELLESGQKDEYNQRLVANPETAGRYHSDWLSMMYPRLKLARNLLTDDGVIFISIDDYEVHNQRKVCDEIFGENNFITALIWNKQHSQQQGLFKKYHEYVLLYAKNESAHKNISGGEGIIEAGALKKISRANPASEFTFPAGVRFDASDGTELSGTFGESEKVTVVKGVLKAKDGKTVNEVTLSAGWTQKDQMTKFFKGENVLDSKGQKVLGFFFNSTGKLKSLKERSKITPSTFLPKYGMVSEQTQHISNLFGKPVFDNPKPVQMLTDFLNWFSDDGDICLDFFSGSGTLAESALKSQNNVKYIVVQLPQKLDSNSETSNNAISLGYKNICEIGKERIRKAAQKIKEETNADIDYGFRVYRLDESNMQDVYYKPQDYEQGNLDLFADNVKSDRTADDLLAQVMLDWGLPLSLKIEQVDVAGKKVFKVAENSLYACFDSGIDEDFAKAIAKDEPLRIVFKDSGFKNDTAKTNVKQLLKQLSPESEMKVI